MSVTDRDISRRDFLKAAAFAATFGGGCVSVQSHRKMSGKKNVLFIAVDDLRPELGCYGHEKIISPNIDRLAGEGVIFSRCYCQVPVCGASRASLLTSIRPTRDRFVGARAKVDEDFPGALTLPQYFKNHGYYTISNGKIFDNQFDRRRSWSESPWRPEGDWAGWQAYVTAEGRAIREANRKATDPEWQAYGLPYESADVADNEYPDGVTADKTIADMRRLAETGEPFFLAAGFLKPHLPFNAPSKYWEMYKREDIDLADNPFRPKGAPDAALHNWSELRCYARIPEEGPLDDETARTLIHGYYACVSYTDAQIGRLLDELDRLGISDNTVVVLWGDHGWNLGEHGLWCKHCNFETSLRSPLIIKDPEFRGGIKTGGLTEFVDIFPSLCELCDLPIPKQLEGTSVVGLMKDPNRKWKKAVFSRYFAGDSVKTDRYRYTEWHDDENNRTARMLYDHSHDPFENDNIAERPENAELVKKLSGMIQRGYKHAAPD